MRVHFRLCLLLLNLCFAVGAAAEVRILFSSDKEDATDRWDLYSIRPDGSDLKRITQTTTRSEWAAALAPDGRRIAFVDNLGDNGNLWLTDLDGTGTINVPISNRAMCVQWADDDTLYYFADIPGGGLQRFQIWQVNLDGSGQAQVYAASYDIFPTGSDSFQFHRPSGRFYFTARIPINSPSVPYSGLPAEAGFDTTFERCTDPDIQPGMLDDHYDVARSPDGDKIAYAADFFDGNHRMYVRDADGNCESQIRVSSGFTGDPHWSSDSRWLVFTGSPESTFGRSPYIGDLYTVDVDGGNLMSRTIAIGRVSGRCAHALVYALAPASFEIDAISQVERGTKLEWEGVAGTEYTVEASDDFGEWTPLGGAVIRTQVNEPLTFTDASALGESRRFYRLVARCL